MSTRPNDDDRDDVDLVPQAEQATDQDVRDALEADSALTRRQALQRIGVGTAALATAGAAGTHVASQEAEAIAPVVAAAAVGGAAGGGVATGWMLREHEVIGSDDPPEGMTPDGLAHRVISGARSRKSDNASTFIDNKNILDGIEHTAYAEGKIAAIEAINNQEPEADVVDAAVNAAEDYLATPQENFLKSWNETVRELGNWRHVVDEHEDLSWHSVTSDYRPEDLDQADETEEYELVDGSTFTLEQVESYRDAASNDGIFRYTPAHEAHDDNHAIVIDANEEYGDYHFKYAKFEEWNDLLETYEDIAGSVTDGLMLWVENVYQDVQSGEMDPEELLTPRELAEMSSDEEEFNQAVADLMALNVSLNHEREAEIYFPEIEGTLYGTLAVSSNTTLGAGDSIDPDEEDESYYLTYDLSRGEGTWSAYDDGSGVDGGVVTFTEEPFEETEYHIHTVADETAVVETDDFEPDDEEEPDEWMVDVFDQLDDAVTDIESIDYYATVTDTQYETILLDRPFEIVTFRDTESDEEHDSASFEPQSESHDDENYFSEEEWEEQQEEYEELIEKYEESQGSDGSGFWPSFGDGSDNTVVAAVIALIALGVAAIHGSGNGGGSVHVHNDDDR